MLRCNNTRSCGGAEEAQTLVTHLLMQHSRGCFQRREGTRTFSRQIGAGGKAGGGGGAANEAGTRNQSVPLRMVEPLASLRSYTQNLLHLHLLLQHTLRCLSSCQFFIFFWPLCCLKLPLLPPPPLPRLPAAPETGLVYSASSTSRLRAAVSLIFLPNICFFPPLIPPSRLLLLFGSILHLTLL